MCVFFDEKRLKMRDGAELFLRIKENGSPVWLICLHGVCEYSGRHQYLMDLFGHEFNILQYDLRGHGRSDGKNVYIEDFRDHMVDLKEVIHYISDKYRMNRYILFGHSLGALIASSFMQKYVDNSIYPERLFLSAPPVGVKGPLGTLLKFLPTGVLEKASRLPMSVPLKSVISLDGLSHDPKVKEHYKSDPLNSMYIHSKLVLEIAKTVNQTFTRPIRPKCPAFVVYGSEDGVASSSDIKNYFSMIEKSFQVKVFEGAFHEIHNEIEKYRKPYFEYLKSVFQEVLYLKN